MFIINLNNFNLKNYGAAVKLLFKKCYNIYIRYTFYAFADV